MCYNYYKEPQKGKIVQKAEKSKRAWGIVQMALIMILCAITVILDFLPIKYVSDSFRNGMLSKIIQTSCGSIAVVLLMLRLRIRVFGKPQALLYLLPCLLVAMDNFQWSAFIQGKMELVRTAPIDVILFTLHCFTIGLFEECIFRGIVISVLASVCPNNKKGFLLTFILSSVVFGLAHLLNGFSWQVLYTMLTGAVFAFCLIKTKNIFLCAFVHGLYNLCGLLFDTQGLGNGVVFDLGTVLTMLIVSVIVGTFILIYTLRYTEEERMNLYERLGVKSKDK